jgi:hypothetical protein
VVRYRASIRRSLLSGVRDAVGVRDVADEERRRFGSVPEQHYSAIDDAIGRAIPVLGQTTCCSWFRPTAWSPRSLEAADRETHRRPRDERHPRDGPGRISHGARRHGRVADCWRAPGGRRRADGAYFLDCQSDATWMATREPMSFSPSFTEERPITFIPTYDR